MRLALDRLEPLPGRVLAAALLVVPLAGCPAREGPAGQGAASLGALDSSVAAYAGLDQLASRPFVVSWGGSTGNQLVKLRREQRLEALDGVPHLRVAFMNAWRPKEDDSVEWWRPDGDRLVCTARRLGTALHRIEPPQPLLVAPLAPGQTWRWEGRVGDGAATAEFRVLRAAEEARSPAGEAWQVVEVEQVTRAGELRSTRVQTWALGLGLVTESGTTPLDPPESRFVGRPPGPGEWVGE